MHVLAHSEKLGACASAIVEFVHCADHVREACLTNYDEYLAGHLNRNHVIAPCFFMPLSNAANRPYMAAAECYAAFLGLKISVVQAHARYK
jgi:hypothetical protein